jgi:RNA polymerase-binding transcription factor DksA
MPTTSHRYLNLERRGARLRQQLGHDSAEPARIDADIQADADPLEIAAASELAQIEHALMRLNQGHGDSCECCGLRIGSERLAALPYATTCADCAAAAVHRQRQPGDQLPAAASFTL